MLRTLTLKNFRKHEDVEFNFVDGLTVIRGSNEAGKSSLGESICTRYLAQTCCENPWTQ